MTNGFVFAEEYTIPSLGKVYDVKVNLQFLIKNGIIVENDYYDMYINLVKTNLNRGREKYKTQCHHIVPKCYFIDNNIFVDDSDSNKVILLHKDHVLAHYYLALCSVEEKFKAANINAIRYALNIPTFKLLPDYEKQKEFIENLEYYEFLQVQRNEYMSKILKGRERNETYRNNIRKAHIGRTWIYKGAELKQVLPDELDFFLSNGWHKGNPRTSAYMQGRDSWNKGVPTREKTKELLRIAKKGRIHINNGKVSKMIFPSEFKEYSAKGFVRGRLSYSRKVDI